MSAPLEGLKVLDMSRVLAGPWAGQLLGDFGADVVKVERPGSGDDTRHWGPPWLGDEAAYFLATNRNKRSIAVDIASDAGQSLLRRLAMSADVVIENFRVGTLARYGLDYGSLSALNPRLIFCSITAFGADSSRASEPGYDAMIQGSAGLMSITGPADTDGGGPQKVGVAVADIMTGMYATSAILAALEERHDSGRGQHIEVPLYDSQVAWLANQAMNYLVGGQVPQRQGTAHPNLVPYQAFPTMDGHFVLAVGNDEQFAACAKLMSRPDLAEDPAFASNAGRVENRDRLVGILAEEFRKAPTDHWLASFRDAGIPAGPINSLDVVLGDDYAKERGLVRQLEEAGQRAVPTVANPVRFSRTPVCYASAPPKLGEDEQSVLRDWTGSIDD
jgi:crotonobetainyl-CoA:carnitine CoA-transferase CaiB-like acyl-CoA transferase